MRYELARPGKRNLLAGELQVDLVPQGTLIECIRAGGFGLGGTTRRRRRSPTAVR